MYPLIFYIILFIHMKYQLYIHYLTTIYVSITLCYVSITLCYVSITLCYVSITLCYVSITLCYVSITLCYVSITLCYASITLCYVSILQQVQQLGQITVQLLLQNNREPVLLNWVIDHCYSTKSFCASLCFHALSNTFAKK